MGTLKTRVTLIRKAVLTGRRTLTRIIDKSQNLTYHTEFFSKSINHSSVNFGNGIEKV